MLDRNRVIQSAMGNHPECISPEPNEIKNGINKCQSSSNIPHLAANSCDHSETAINTSKNNYTITKSVSGTNIGMNGQKKVENENSSSASGISSPSNNSQREEDEKYVKAAE